MGNDLRTGRQQALMVNFSLNAGSLMGIILALAGAGLYFLRSFRPNLARDYDVFFAAIALLCGGILFFQSWRLDPILQFGVFLLAGSTVFFAVDSIRLRNIATEQAKRNTPLVDDDRPVSRSYQYQAELDNYDQGYNSFEERQPMARRIRGSRDGRPPEYGDQYEAEGNRRPGPRRSPRSLDRGDGGNDRPRRAPSRTAPPDRSGYDRDAWDDAPAAGYGNSYDSPPSGYEESGYGPAQGYGSGNETQDYQTPTYGAPPVDSSTQGYGDGYGTAPRYDYEPRDYESRDYEPRDYEPSAQPDTAAGAYGAGYGDGGDATYGDSTYSAGTYGSGLDQSVAGDRSGSVGDSGYSRPAPRSPEEPTPNSNRRPRRRPPSSVMSRSPLAGDYGNQNSPPYTDYKPLETPSQDYDSDLT